MQRERKKEREREREIERETYIYVYILRATGGVRHFSVSPGDTEIGVVFPTR
jgi:hypothetical protein